MRFGNIESHGPAFCPRRVLVLSTAAVRKGAQDQSHCSLAYKCSINNNSLASPEQSLYDLVTEDSVLFPEGGGQPCDHGTINGTIAVQEVVRRGDQCVKRVTVPFTVGDDILE